MGKINSQLGLYFHFPYCARRCPYCDFTLTTSPIPHHDYLVATLRELDARLEELNALNWSSQPLVSLYLGGGSPSLWEPTELGQLIDGVTDRLGFQSGAEITIEANPEEIDVGKVSAWKSFGINRVSLGVQSMREEGLQALGRQHSPQQVYEAVQLIREVGISRLNIDLIHGLRGEGSADALFDLEAALALDVGHLSLYQLTVEDKTDFGYRAKRGEQLIEPEERLIMIADELHRRLEEKGFRLYEVSNAARPGEEAVHNSLYWTMGQYLGIGAGAHGRIDLPSHGGELRALRWQNSSSPKRYLRQALHGEVLDLGLVEDERTVLDQEEVDEERLLVGLRLEQGVVITASVLERYQQHAQKLIEQGLLILSPPDISAPLGRWRASKQGRSLLDHVTMKLILG